VRSALGKSQPSSEATSATACDAVVLFLPNAVNSESLKLSMLACRWQLLHPVRMHEEGLLACEPEPIAVRMATSRQLFLMFAKPSYRYNAHWRMPSEHWDLPGNPARLFWLNGMLLAEC
jgi:hypothetical protein